jgi:hypothetical protein
VEKLFAAITVGSVDLPPEGAGPAVGGEAVLPPADDPLGTGITAVGGADAEVDAPAPGPAVVLDAHAVVVPSATAARTASAATAREVGM